MGRSRLYCTVLYCTVLYCIVLYCTVLYCGDTIIRSRVHLKLCIPHPLPPPTLPHPPHTLPLPPLPSQVPLPPLPSQVPPCPHFRGETPGNSTRQARHCSGQG